MTEKILVLLDSSIKKLWDGLGYKRGIWNTLLKSPLDGMYVSPCGIWEVEVGGMEVIKLIPGGEKHMHWLGQYGHLEIFSTQTDLLRVTVLPWLVQLPHVPALCRSLLRKEVACGVVQTPLAHQHRRKKAGFQNSPNHIIGTSGEWEALRFLSFYTFIDRLRLLLLLGRISPTASALCWTCDSNKDK